MRHFQSAWSIAILTLGTLSLSSADHPQLKISANGHFLVPTERQTILYSGDTLRNHPPPGGVLT